jgi:hypothetical protein
VFPDASVELRYRAGTAVTIDDQHDGGWAWHDEVWRLRYGIGVDGFTEEQKTQFDGLVLLLNILLHTSNPAHQNRLVCDMDRLQRIGTWRYCSAPTLLVHDLGSVLGKKASRSLRSWRRASVWRHPTGCETALPFKMDKPGEREYLAVGQSGREFLLQRMDRFTDAHWLALLESARFENFDATLYGTTAEPDSSRRQQIYEEWIEGFREKVEEIRGRECPNI